MKGSNMKRFVFAAVVAALSFVGWADGTQVSELTGRVVSGNVELNAAVQDLGSGVDSARVTLTVKTAGEADWLFADETITAPKGFTYLVAGLCPGTGYTFEFKVEPSGGEPVVCQTNLTPRLPPVKRYGLRSVEIDSVAVSGDSVTAAVSYGAGAAGELYACYGLAAGGDLTNGWEHAEKVCDVGAEAGSANWTLASGWGTSACALRFFIVYVAYDKRFEYLASSGTDGAQYIDTGYHLKQEMELTIEWAQNDSSVNEDKGWGTGTGSGLNVTGAGRYRNGYITPWIFSSDRPFSPTYLPTSQVSVGDPSDWYLDRVTTTNGVVRYEMTHESDGYLRQISPVTLPENYDSGNNIYIFRDVNNPYNGHKRVRSFTLYDVMYDTLLLDLVPCEKDGKACFYNRVNGTFLYNSETSKKNAFLTPERTLPLSAEVVGSSAYSFCAPTELPIGVRTPVLVAERSTAVDVRIPLIGLGLGAASAEVKLVWWEDDGEPTEETVATVTAIGDVAGTVRLLLPGHTYRVKARVTNNLGQTVESGILTVTTTEPQEKRVAIRALTLDSFRPSGAGFTATLGYAAGTTNATIYACLGAGTGGEGTNGWERVVKVADVDTSAGSVSWTLDSGWGTADSVVRFCLVCEPYDTRLEYLAATGSQYVDTGYHLKKGMELTLEWAQNAAQVSEDKGWGTGTSTSANNVTGGGRVNNGYVRPYIFGANRSFVPELPTSQVSIGGDPSDWYLDRVTTTDDYVRYEMTHESDGFLRQISPVKLPANYDSGNNIYIFRDVNNQYNGRKRIRSFTLYDAANDVLLLDLVPCKKDGKACFYNRVNGDFLYSLSGTFVAGDPVAAEPETLGTTEFKIYETPVAPIGVETPTVLASRVTAATVAMNVTGLGLKATKADILLAWGVASDALSTTNVVAAEATGPGTYSCELFPLVPGKVYYLQAVVANDVGETAASETITLKTDAPEVVRIGPREVEFVSFKPHGDSVTAKVSYGAGPAGALYACYGGSQIGDGSTNGWERVTKVADVGDEAGEATWTLDAGWGTDFVAMRFCIVYDAYERRFEYLASTGVQYVDTGSHIRQNQELVVRWAQHAAPYQEDKGYGAGVDNPHAVIGGGRIYYSAVTPYIFQGNYSFDTALPASDLKIGDWYVDTIRLTDGVVRFTMLSESTGREYNITPVTIPAEFAGQYDSGNDIYFFRDSTPYPYPGRKRISGATLKDALTGEYVFDLVPCEKGGELGYYDRVTTNFYPNVGGGDLEAGPEIARSAESLGSTGLRFYEDASLPVLTIASLDGTGGDTLVVKGTLDSFPGEDCTLAVLVGTSEDALTARWTGLDGAVRTEEGAFALTLCEKNVHEARYLAPGASYYVAVEATSAGKISRTATLPVTMASSPRFDAVSATISRRTLNVNGTMAEIGVGDERTVELWVGDSSDPARMTKVGEATVTRASAAFAFSYDCPNFDTRYWWQVRTSATTAGGTATFDVPTAAAAADTLDTTTYTWKKSVAEGNWDDAANWESPYGEDSRGYPQSAAATAVFAAGTTNTVWLRQAMTVGSLNLGAQNADVTFRSDDADDAPQLTLNGLTPPAKNTRWTLDHANVWRDGTVYMPAYSAIVLDNGANLRFGSTYFNAAGGTRIELRRDSQMSVGELGGGNGSTIVLDDSTFEVRNYDYIGYYAGEMCVRFEGTHPKWRHVNGSGHFRATNGSAMPRLDFLVPEGGYESVPFEATVNMNVRMGCNGTGAGSHTIEVNVLDESPAAFARGDLTYELVRWPGTYGIDPAMIVTNNVPHEVPGSEFVWGEGTYPNTLSVKIVGYVSSNFIVVKSNDVEYNPDGFNADSVYGKHSLADGEQVTLSAPTEPFGLSEGERVYVVGWELWSKLDDDSDEMSLVKSSANPGAGEDDRTCKYKHEHYSELIWLWRHQKRVKVTVVGGEHGSVSDLEQWIDAGDGSTVTATPEEGYAVAWTAGIANERMFENPLVIDETVDPYDLTATFFRLSANEGEKAGLFASYAHSTPITFAGYDGTTTLTNFTALVRLAEGDGSFRYNDCKSADGRDVRFCGADGREIDSEVVSWDSSGTSEFWVKIPELKGRRTRIHLVWGNAAAPARTPRTYAFNKGYRGVWTMESAKNVLLDRSVYGQHAPCFEWAVTSVVDGVVGGARRFSGTSDCYAYLGLGDVQPMEPEEFTAECWFRVAEYPADWTYFLASGTRSWNATGQACSFGIDGEGRIFGSNCGGYESNAGRRRHPLSQKIASKGEWHHAAYTQAANGEEFLYLDGVVVGCYTNVMPNFGWGKVFYSGTSRPGNPTLGGWWPSASTTYYRYYAGDMDEARLSGEVRSADWLRATYLNVASNSVFAVFGGERETLTVDGAPRPLVPTVEVAAPESEQGGVRRTCTGYEVVADGKLVESGAGSSVARTWPSNATDVAVAWNWKTEYKVTVDGVSGWYEAGTILPVAAGAAPSGQAFHSWGGNCPTLEVFSASFDLPVDGPRTLTPNYAPLTEVSTNGCADADEAGLALKSAIDAAVAAGTPQVVLVDDGVYAVAHTNVLTISSPVVVRSKNGFEKTALLQLKNPAQNNPAWTMIKVSHPGALLEGLDFQSYGGYGGAYQSIASVTEGHFSKCRFVMQTGRGYGAINGPRFVTQSGGWCRDCVFTAFDAITRSFDSGGAGTFDNMIMDGCVITNLRTSSAYNYLSSPIRVGVNAVIRNTLVAKNFSCTDHNGGAASIDGYSAKGAVFENCTIADNKNYVNTTSSAKGGGIYTDYPLLVVNTILSGNLANGSVLGDDFYGPVGAVHSMSKDFTGGEFGSMTALPAYVQDEDGTTDPLYRTRGVSPSRDAGYPTVWSRSLGAWDLLGSNRVDEAEVDVGACEYAPSEEEEFDVNVRIEGDFNQRDCVEVTFIAAVSGAKGEVSYAWDFGDGTTSTEANPVHVYTHGGWYAVQLVVSDEGGHSAVYDSPSPVKVKPSVCYINDAGSATPPYATRETGAKGGSSLADVFGDRPTTIVICSNTVARNVRGRTTQVNFPVTIVGEDRETSTMDYMVNVTGPGTVLSSLTYTGGDGSYTGLSVSKTLVTNVVFRKTAVNGNGFALKADEGTRIVDSVFVNINPNHASGGTGSAALRIVGKDVVVERCVVTNNFSAGGANTYAAAIRVAGAYDPMPVVRNSFIGYNRCFDTATRMNAVGGAGIYAEGPVRVENCTIVSNQTCGAGAAIYVAAGAAEIVNTIIASNVGGMTNAAEIRSNEVYVAEGASVTWQKCRVPAEAGIDDNGVTTVDPKFNFGKKPAEPYWSLLADSPLKNRGVKLGWMTPEAKDLGGQKRVFNAKPDLGCYESQVGGTVIIVR